MRVSTSLSARRADACFAPNPATAACSVPMVIAHARPRRQRGFHEFCRLASGSSSCQRNCRVRCASTCPAYSTPVPRVVCRSTVVPDQRRRLGTPCGGELGARGSGTMSATDSARGTVGELCVSAPWHWRALGSPGTPGCTARGEPRSPSRSGSRNVARSRLTTGCNGRSAARPAAEPGR